MTPSSSIAGFGEYHLCIYLTCGLRSNLETTSTFPSSFVFPSLESSKIWPLKQALHFLNDFSCPLLCHRRALLEVQRQDCTQTSRFSTKPFFLTPFLTVLPVFLALRLLLPRSHQKALGNGRGTSSALWGLVLGWVSCKLFTKALSILYQPLLEFSRLRFLFTLCVPHFSGLPYLPRDSLLNFLIELCRGEVWATIFYLCQTFYLGFSYAVFLSLLGVCRLLAFELLILSFRAFFPIFA